MKNIYFSEKEFKEIMRNNRINRGTEATIYQYKDDILKVYFQKNLRFKEKEINYILNRDKIKGCVMPKGKVYIEKDFMGIRMNYYEDYVNLGSSLETNQDSYKKRLILCKKIVEAIKNLHSNDICHNDVHSDNIIYNPKLEDALLIDVDGGTPKELLTSQDFHKKVKGDKYNLMVVILSYLYQIDFEVLHLVGEVNIFKNMLNSIPVGDNLKNYINNFDNTDTKNVEYIDAYFDELKEPQHSKIKKLQNKL